MSRKSIRIAAWATAAAVLAAYALVAIQPSSSGWAQAVETALFVLVGLALPASAAIAIRHSVHDTRVAWIALLVTALLSVTGEVLRLLDAARPSGGAGMAAARDYVFLASYLAIFVLAASLSRRRTIGGIARARYLLDVAAVFLALGAVGHLLLAPSIAARVPLLDSRAAFFAFAFPVLDILLLVVIAVIALGSRGARWEGWELLLISTVLALAVLDILVTRALLASGAPGTLDFLTGLSVFVPTTLATMGAVYYITGPKAAVAEPSARWDAASRVPDLVLPAISIGVVPLLASNVNGGTGFASPSVPITIIAMISLILITRSAVLTLENASLFKTTLNDPLTSLYNARMYHERLDEEIARAARTGAPVSVANIDIDEFAKVNNLYGHEAGDDCIRHVAMRLRDSVRAFDTVCRVGGDEFGVIMPGTTPESARAVCLRLQESLESGETPCHAPIRLSIGIAGYPLQAHDAETLVRRADGAMYWVKYHGRNGTMIYEPELIDSLDATARARRDEETARLQSVEALAATADARDPFTRNHSKNVAALAVRFSEELGLSPNMIAELEIAALLHDVGSIGTPDYILNSDRELTAVERLTVQEHVGLGERIVASAHPGEIAGWIAAHHERWDGAGYPYRLAGDTIPLGARIIAICDAFDSMTSDRAYRLKRSHREALEELVRGAGTQFDPALVPVFMRSMESPFPDLADAATSAAGDAQT